MKKIVLPQLPARSFYYVRHGQTDWNKKRILMGQQDVPLNEEGIAQAHKVAQQIKELEISLIIASPLIRALKTATIIADVISKNVATMDELKECSAGILEGKDRGNYEALEYWRLGGNIEGAESWHMFVQRVHDGLYTALSIEHPKPVLVVAHGAVYWAIQEILRLEEHTVANCSIILHEPGEENNWRRQFITE